MDLGVGVGSIPEEYEALGVSFHERGAIANEMLDAMRVLWTEEDPEFKGKYYAFSGAKFSPKPVQSPYPPLEIGGASPAALRRGARVGGGGHPTVTSPKEIREGLATIRSLAEAMGRDAARIGVSLPLNWRPEEDTGGSVSEERPGLAGTSEGLVSQVREYEAARVNRIIMDFASDDVEATLRGMERFAVEVFGAFG